MIIKFNGERFNIKTKVNEIKNIMAILKLVVPQLWVPPIALGLIKEPMHQVKVIKRHKDQMI